MNSNKKFYNIFYKFRFLNNSNIFEFNVSLDSKTLIAESPKESIDCEWTKLEFCQCDICPLNSNKYKNCPIAYNISGLAQKFSTIYSIEEAEITVIVEERNYSKIDSIQNGLRSILGIYMAASGCPNMNFLKPMVRFHLPFATIEETIYRQVSNYLLMQYFEYLETNNFDYSLSGLLKYNEMALKVNNGICNRISHILEGDAGKNALVILNAIGIMLKIEVLGNLDSLKYLYEKLRF